MDDLDIRWDNYSHREIADMVNAGPGASLTATMEEHLHRVSDVLNDLADQVSKVIARTGDEWDGGAAAAATNAMSVLRSVDDGMHFTSNLAGVRVFGQSDNVSWVRANMPPMVAVHPPEPTGRLIDILNASVDFQKQQAAAKQAEQRAREIMQQYTEATRARAAGMTPLSPVPQVVLDVTSEPAKPPAGGGGRPPRSRNLADGPPEGGPTEEPDKSGGPAEESSQRVEPLLSNPPTRGTETPPAAVSSITTQSAAAPGANASPAVSASPAQPVQAPGGSGSALPLAGGRSEARVPGAESPGRRGAPLVERGPAGASTESLGRGGSPARGSASRLAGASPFAPGPATRPEEDRDHQVKYGLPSAEHFEPDAELDPHRVGWHVAPEVIGDRDEDG